MSAAQIELPAGEVGVQMDRNTGFLLISVPAQREQAFEGLQEVRIEAEVGRCTLAFQGDDSRGASLSFPLTPAAINGVSHCDEATPMIVLELQPVPERLEQEIKVLQQSGASKAEVQSVANRAYEAAQYRVHRIPSGKVRLLA